jgi:hypothetical protein
LRVYGKKGYHHEGHEEHEVEAKNFSPLQRNLRVLRDLRGEQNNLNDTHDPQKWPMNQLERETFKWKNSS